MTRHHLTIGHAWGRLYLLGCGLLALGACVGGDGREGQTATETTSHPDVPCPDDCAEDFPTVPACSRAVWSTETCSCHLEPLPENARCDDKNACTLEDRCVSSDCQGTLVDLGTFCDDGDPCTDDRCDQYDGCVTTARDAACDDGNDCTLDEVCEGGLCHWQTQYVCATCDPHTDDGGCEAGYGNDDRCDGLLACTDGFCETDPKSVVSCHDPRRDPCTSAACDPASGDCVLSALADDASCIDRSPCTIDDHCVDGICTGTALTTAECTCAEDADCAAFDDGDLCNGVFFCDHDLGGVCRFAFDRVVVCDASSDSACSVARCDPGTGACAPVPVDDQTPCDDGDLCTVEDACDGGACVGVARDCDVVGLCVHGRCDADLGCVVEPTQGGSCDPNLPCVLQGTCDAGVCVPVGPPCDDGDDCTTDVCLESGLCDNTGPPKPTCLDEGACAVGVDVVCHDGGYRCAYENVPGYGDVELCEDAIDNDCDGDASEANCVSAHGCGPGSILNGAFGGGAMQACADGQIAATCGAGWHTCSYSQMLDALGDLAPPSGYRIAASVVYDPVNGYRAEDREDGACVELTGICTLGYIVQAISWDGVFGQTVAYAAEAWGCIGGTASSSCAEFDFAGVLCCQNQCGDHGECNDGDPCTVDACDGRGQCRSTPKPGPVCATEGVCAGQGLVCDDDTGTYACGYLDDPLYAPSELTCDGLDNDCDGKVDAADADLAGRGPACSKQLGVCAGAKATTCAVGQWQACTDQIYAAHADAYEAGIESSCDGLDNDCDGETDNAFTYFGARVGESCDGLGACGVGEVVCLPNASGATCSTNPDASTSGAAVEDCDGLDNDCDGATDEPEDLDPTLADCGDTGVCAGGVPVRCKVDGELPPRWHCDYSEVIGYSEHERCDGVDDDCDGDTDEGYTYEDAPVGSACPESDCEGARVVCTPDGSDATCSLDEDAGEESVELCDGVDNDCDAKTDEGLFYVDDGSPVALGEACSGEGACGPGTVVCGASKTATCSTLPDGPDSQASAEICNGLDDDCDGQTDEGMRYDGVALGQWCDGRGACGEGTVVCGPVSQVATCSTNPDGTAPQAQPELCNGDDDDCDGTPDDGVVVGPNDCAFAGVCTPQTGSFICTASGWDCSFEGAPYYAESEAGRCDGRDNDCNGQTDELFANLGQPCRMEGDLDQCARGTFACKPTGTGTVCVGDTHTPELCNGLDDDCDSLTDEAGATGCTTFYLDGDGDGFGKPGSGTCRCAATPGPGGWVGNAQDCNDQSAAVNPSRPEVCDGVDNDCDLLTDAQDGVDLIIDDPRLCELGQGVCAGTQKPASRCTDGTWKPCLPADYLAHDPRYQHGHEQSCDGVDNDCDGKTDGLDVDDMTPLRPACASQAGVCQGAKKPLELCGAAGWGPCTSAHYAAHSQFFEPSQELSCDAKDNDCDGGVDEPFTFAGKSVGQACDGTGTCGVGVVVCRGDNSGATCSTNPDGPGSQAGTEVCNNLDDDCDGVTDDNLGVLQSTCRLNGQCNANNVSATCAQGAWLCNYSQVPSYENGTEQSCDDKDNDCDGTSDEDFAIVLGGQTLKKGDPCGAGGSCQGVVICHTATPAPGDLVCSSSLATVPESCDELDNNCNGLTDEGLGWTPPGGQPIPMGGACNGLGECGVGVVECSATQAATCSTNPDGSQPGHVGETCDGKDNDCDGLVDDGFAWNGVLVGRPCDGVGACGAGTVECSGPNAARCSTNPGGSQSQVAEETCDGTDQDCDGTTDEGLDIYDSTCLLGGVCTAQNVVATCLGTSGWGCGYGGVANYHASDEVGFCDTLDNDCDGQTDEDDAEVGDACDGGDPDLCASGVWACAAPNVADVPVAGFVRGEPYCAGDVNRVERCNGQDDDCDGQTDERDAADCQIYFKDQDEDGWGVHADARCLCGPDAQTKYTSQSPAPDCDDLSPLAFPGADEYCDGDDNDCDGGFDEEGAVDCHDFYFDEDHDFHGSGKNAARCFCEVEHGEPFGYTAEVDDDCNDKEPTAYPGAPERCDRLDNDCDLAIDEGENPIDCTHFYKDADNDHYGSSQSRCMCEATNEYHALNDDDCCDADARVNPVAGYRDQPATQCGNNQWDFDCDGQVELQWQANGQCACPAIVGEDGSLQLCQSCSFLEGWTGTTVPFCGVNKQWLWKCQAHGTPTQCQSNTRSQKQACK